MNDINDILNELQKVRINYSKEKIVDLINNVANKGSIFLSGSGRSGLMIKAFANRLTQLGIRCHITNEITAPAITKDDLLIINSASGNSLSLMEQLVKAHDIGSKIMVVTNSKNNKICKYADEVVVVNAPSKDSKKISVQPMGSLFEQTSLLIFDNLILALVEKNDVTFDQLRNKHSNLE